MISFGKTRTTPRRFAATLLAAVALSLLVAACARGTYAVDVFPEMHYNQSTKIQEPPRLSPPDGAVPVTGREVTYTAAEASGLVNPLLRTDDVLAQGRESYRVNCSMCHGVTAQGDGAVGLALEANGYVRPPNLTAPTTQGRTDGDIYFLITSGIFVMPEFGLMLPPDDRWALVQYLRALAEQQAGG